MNKHNISALQTILKSYELQVVDMHKDICIYVCYSTSVYVSVFFIYALQETLKAYELQILDMHKYIYINDITLLRTSLSLYIYIYYIYIYIYLHAFKFTTICPIEVNAFMDSGY